MPEADTLLLWTVYYSPADFPGQYVARAHHVGQGWSAPTTEHFVAATLEEARALLPPGLFCLGREPQDEPCIVESWM